MDKYQYNELIISMIETKVNRAFVFYKQSLLRNIEMATCLRIAPNVQVMQWRISHV